MPEVSKNVIDYIRNHKEFLSPKAPDYMQVGVVNIAGEKLKKQEFTEFVQLLYEAGYKTFELRQKALLMAAKEYCILCLSKPRYEDTAKSWSRLQYVLSGIPDYNLSYYECLDAFKIYGKDYGFNLKPIPDDCAWEGSGDYDLGWFDINEFRRTFVNGQ